MYLPLVGRNWTAIILGAVIIGWGVAASPGAHADEIADSMQSAIETLMDAQNAHLAEMFFDKAHYTPRIAAMETVESAIELYDMTKTPQVAVSEQEYFVRHAANPFGSATAVAFDVIGLVQKDNF